jgi:hypothetical protein
MMEGRNIAGWVSVPSGLGCIAKLSMAAMTLGTI